jgi:hypothetical protein
MLVAVLAVVLLATQVVKGPAEAPGGSSSPGPALSSSPTAKPSTSLGSALPPLIRSSLATALTVNEQLASRGNALAETIAVKKPVAEEIATILRRINTDMVTGTDAANNLLVLPETAELGDALLTFYGAVAAQNAKTLGASVRVVAPYLEGARNIIKLLGALEPLNAKLRSALADAGAEPLPPVGPSNSPTPAADATSRDLTVARLARASCVFTAPRPTMSPTPA